MPNLQTTSAAQLLKATGNAGLEIANVRKGPKGNAPADSVANMGENFQRQIDAIKQVLLAPPPPVTNFNVVDTMGALIAWIGSSIVAGVTYFGAWFRNLYIGGTSAADAKIIADADGNVTINGATITLTKNGVKTTIENDMGPDGQTESLTSEDISVSHGQFTAVTPFYFICYEWDPGLVQYEAVATLRGAGDGTGRLTLGRVGGGPSALFTAGGVGSPQALVSDGTGNSSFLRPLEISSGAGFTAAGVPGITHTDALVTSISVSTSSISYASGTNTATFVDGVSTTTSSAGYKGGLRTT